MRKGSIKPDYYITCGACERGEHVGESVLRIARQSAWDQGWRQTKERGWVCPDCAPSVCAEREKEQE